MLALDDGLAGGVVAEVVLWGVPLVLAGLLAWRGAPPARRTWGVVALACAVIVTDKVVDLQSRVFATGKGWIRAHAPELMREGLRQEARLAILAALFVLGCLGLWLLVRRSGRPSASLVLALAGLVSVMAFVGLRLVPSVGAALGTTGATAAELACAGLVWLGALAALRRSET